MKKIAILSLIVFWFCGTSASAKEFLGAPLLPETKTLLKTKKRIEMKSGLSHDQVLEFYREALRDTPDIKFRKWEDATYIEDDGGLAWHSITISKGDPQETSIVIVKDNWTWIIGTLVLRFVGVFVVLLVLFIGMTISGKIISSSVKRAEAKKAASKS
jgi:hypothetical protein